MELFLQVWFTAIVVLFFTGGVGKTASGYGSKIEAFFDSVFLVAIISLVAIVMFGLLFLIWAV